MNNYKWSAKYNAFFPVALLPEYKATWELSDLVDVSDAVQAEFCREAPEGKIRGVVDGMPAWIDIPPPSTAEIAELAEIKKSQLRVVADVEIAWRQDAVDAGIATAEETAALSEWKTYRVLLMRADTSAPDITWPVQPV
ncbi:tail fiber assembly protein [Escherichia coli]|uniref:tail fiber assembly protein n=1 Tax=Escherichia coli TaxID=562 RepID=UPI001FAA3B73|nr:tail fiber assembly protein [Escherichia coli]EEX2874306.1 hypothetical protein [Escherichia coli]EKD4439700.1 tail fiber assembly protein [Escherichia coli]MCI4858947.1 tail fiber assembly protein [Escherichia coli]